MTLPRRRRDFVAGDQKFALSILHVRNRAGKRRSIDMHIEDVEKDADARLPVVEIAHPDYFAVRGRYQHIPRRRHALRITEEIQAIQRQNVEGRTRPGVQKVRKCEAQ